MFNVKYLKKIVSAPHNTIAYFIDAKNDEDIRKLFSVNKQNGTVSFDCHVEPGKEKCLDRDGTDGTNGKELYTIFFTLRDNDGIGKKIQNRIKKYPS